MNMRTRRLRRTEAVTVRRLMRRIAMAALIASALPIAAQADCGPCDDGRACMSGAGCIDGFCAGGTPAVPAACDWAVVGGNASADSRTRAGYRSVVEGSVCSQQLRIDGRTKIDGDVVATASSGSGIRLGAETVVGGTVVTAGAEIVARTRSTQAAVVEGDGGTSLVADCQDAIGSVKPTITTLDSVAFRSTNDEGNVAIPAHADYTLTATKPLNVLDFSSLVAGDWSTITLDGNSIPNVTFVLRVNRKLYLHFHSSLVLAGGAAPERVILYGREECRIGQGVHGAGTIFCPYDSLTMDRDSHWTGALVGGGDRIDLRHDVQVAHVPSEVPVP